VHARLQVSQRVAVKSFNWLYY